MEGSPSTVRVLALVWYSPVTLRPAQMGTYGSQTTTAESGALLFTIVHPIPLRVPTSPTLVAALPARAPCWVMRQLERPGRCSALLTCPRSRCNDRLDGAIKDYDRATQILALTADVAVPARSSFG